MPDQVHPIFQKRRVAICGGTRVSKENSLFCQFLGEELAKEDNIIILTGGFKSFLSEPDVPSGDYSVIQGVLRHFDGKLPDGKVETLHPDPVFESRNTERFSAGTSVILKNKTLQARRFALVNRSDVIISVEGRRGTKEIIDLAFAIEKPCFPIPFTGGLSSQRWMENRKVVCELFEIGSDLRQELETFRPASENPDLIREYALTVKQLILKKLKRKCFIIMPFNEKYDDFFNHIKTVLNGEGFEPVRTDEITFVGNIVDMIRQGLLSSDFSLAEISDARPNVMYEIGLAHAFGKPVIMFTNQENISELPFDIKNERVFLYNDFAEVGEVLKKVLREYKGNSSIL